MYSAKQKVEDAASVAKEHVDVFKAKAEEKAEKGMARSKGEKEVSHEVRKAKEAEAKMNMHEAKADHHHHHHHHGVGGAAVAPAYPPK